MRRHFPTLYDLADRLPESLMNPGASIWIVVGAIMGFVLGERSMLLWVQSFINDEVAATILIPAVLIGFAAFGMSLGVTLQRVREHRRVDTRGERVDAPPAARAPMDSASSN